VNGVSPVGEPFIETSTIPFATTAIALSLLSRSTAKSPEAMSKVTDESMVRG